MSGRSDEPARPSRIAIVIGSMGAGGAERVTATLAEAWAAQGRDVHIVTVASGATDFYRLDGGVRRHALDLARDTGSLPDALRATGQRIRALRSTLGSIDPDVVVGMTTTAGILSIIASSGRRWRVVVEEHIHPPKMPPGRPWELLRRWTYPRAARVVMLTSESLEWLRRTIPGAKGMVIPNPIAYPVADAEPVVIPDTLIGHDRRLLLAAGRLAPQKGFDLLIPAFASIADDQPDWDLVILGEGPERGALERQVAGHGLSARVRLPGIVGNVARWYARADLFVMSSRFEGFPMTLGEALAAGVPAVSYDCETGPRDLIEDGREGCLVRPVEDVAALAEGLARVMRDDAARAHMAREAVRVRDRYSLERILELWDGALANAS